MCELPSAYVCDQPTARKKHKCCECRGTIRVGEKYHKHHGIWGGRPGTYKVCPECEALRAQVNIGLEYSDEQTGFGELTETVFESRDLQLIRAYILNRHNRGSVITEWMLEREARLTAIQT